MSSTSRFECASSSLTLRALLRKTTRVFWTCAAVGIAAHLSLTQIAGVQAEQKVAKPLTTQFVKRAPRLTKPLELKKRPQPRRRIVQREMVAVKARMERTDRVASFQPTQVLKGLARPGVDIGRVLAPQAAGFEPHAVAAAIVGTRESQQKIDMSLELLDVSAMDTGQYHAMVVQDPEDKRNIRGFCRLAVVYSESLSKRLYGDTGQTFIDLAVTPVVRTLSDAMNRYTSVRTGILGRIMLCDAELFKTPWVYFYSPFSFELSDSELTGLGKYLTAGGLVFADTAPHPAYRGGFRAIAGSIKGAVETQGIGESDFQILPSSHPVYHCYFDFDAPPIAGDAPVHDNREAGLSPTDFLEGLEVDGRLTAILSTKAYYSPWSGKWGTPEGGSYRDLDPEPALRFGVNLIVFALTQEGSITRRLMEGIH